MLWIEEDKTMVVWVMKDLVGEGVHRAVDELEGFEGRGSVQLYIHIQKRKLILNILHKILKQVNAAFCP